MIETDLGPRAAELRREIRPWLEANRLDGLVGMGGVDMHPNHHQGELRELLDEWASRLVGQRLICASWPEAYGGRGLGPLEVAALYEELLRVGMPRIVRGMGENLVGPSIIAHGTDKQKMRFLPRIVSGEENYCQGFSEPGAGSDLASLATRGVIDGNEVVITGQKVWTSWHREVSMVFTLCRTNPDAPKHHGITYVLVPIDQPGIEIRPLRQLTGGDEFAETFYDEARAPLANVIGPIDGGWKVAMTTLGSERGATATTQHLRYEHELEALIEVARQSGRISDPIVRQDLAWAHTQVQLMRFSGLRKINALLTESGGGAGDTTGKLFWSEFHSRFGEIALSIVGPGSMVRPEEDGSAPGVWEGAGYRLDKWQQVFFWSRAGTIYAGTSEIQRNIIAERALGLPRDPT